jgi:Na+-driven multidrug efflux pump
MVIRANKPKNYESIEENNQIKYTDSYSEIDTNLDKFYTNESSLKLTFKIMMSLMSVNIAFFIFNNSQLTIILSFANNKYNNDETLTTAIGTVGTILNILLYPLLSGLSGVVEIIGSQAFGAKRYDIFRDLINKARIVGFMIILLTGIFVLFYYDNLFDIWQLKSDIRALSMKIIFIRIFSTVFEFETYLMLRYIQIKNKSAHGIWILAINGLLLPLYCYIFLNKMDLYATGCGLVYLLNNSSIIVTIWLFVLIFCHDTEILYLFDKGTLNHLCTFLKYFLPLYLLSLMDTISSEAMSFYANYFEKKLYSAYLNAYSLYYLVGTISTALNISINIIMSTSIGFGKPEITKTLFKHLICLSLILGIIIGLLLYIFCDKFISWMVEPGEIFSLTKEMFKISLLCNLTDMITYVFGSSMKALGRIYLSLCIYAFSNVLNMISIYFFSFKTEMKINGIFFGYFLNDLFLLFLYIVAFIVFVDFNKSAKEVKQNIEEFNEDK